MLGAKSKKRSAALAIDAAHGTTGLVTHHKKQKRSCGLLMTADGMHQLHRLALPRRANYVYFLIRKQRVIYIGMTCDVMARVVDHKRAGKVFDDVLYLHAADDEASVIERRLINEFEPPLNDAGVFLRAMKRSGGAR